MFEFFQPADRSQRSKQLSLDPTPQSCISRTRCPASRSCIPRRIWEVSVVSASPVSTGAVEQARGVLNMVKTASTTATARQRTRKQNNAREGRRARNRAGAEGCATAGGRVGGIASRTASANMPSRGARMAS
jgi:hypothetical protein